MGFLDWLTGAPPAPAQKAVAPPEPEKIPVAPEGGAWMIGEDEYGNPIKLFIQEGIWLPRLGTLACDEDGRPVSYFASNGWNLLPINPKLLKFEPYLIPFKP